MGCDRARLAVMDARPVLENAIDCGKRKDYDGMLMQFGKGRGLLELAYDECPNLQREISELSRETRKILVGLLERGR